MKIEAKIASLGIALPEQSEPKAMYIPVSRLGNALFVSGQVAFRDGVLLYPGKVGGNVTLEQAQEAARVCIVNMLSAVKAHVGNLDRIRKIVKVQAFVSSAEGFAEQHIVVNAASQLLFDVFGEAGRHARTAIGTNQLPMDASIEIEAIFELAE